MSKSKGSAPSLQRGSDPTVSVVEIEEIRERLNKNLPVRRRFSGLGRLHIDRQLPFLCIYRRPGEDEDLGTERLVMAEASYLFISEKQAATAILTPLLRTVIEVLAHEFGAFLLLEVWANSQLLQPEMNESGGLHPPLFRVHSIKREEIRKSAEALKVQLEKIRIQKKSAGVKILYGKEKWPATHQPMLPFRQLQNLSCSAIGLEIAPIYRSADNEKIYPLIMRALRRALSPALKRTFHHFAKTQTSHIPPSYQALGRKRVVKAVWEVDEQLAGISDSFDFLLQMTPVNIESVWLQFKRMRFQENPVFQYRPLPIDPVLMKRKLYQIPIERVEDPTLQQLFWEKQMEIDRQLMVLADRDTSRALYGSSLLYGNLDTKLVQRAKDLMESLPSRTRETSRGEFLDAGSFAERARKELRYYRRINPKFTASVQVRKDIYSGLMVSRGQLLVGKNTRIPLRRAEALLNHEVGTHLVTYYNGRFQPLRQLYVGFAGYDELQEGLAVLAEYLVGGLSRARLRLLAARVIAAQSIMSGASFIQVFQLLYRTYQFDQKTAFTVTMRIFRGGGLIKDAVYLRGLFRILDYLQNKGELEPLYIGKIAAHHIPLIKELQWREVLRPMPFRPRFLDQESSLARLGNLRNGYSLSQMICDPIRKRR